MVNASSYYIANELLER